MSGNNDRSKVLALMFAVTGIILLMVSFVLPWWGYHTERERRSSDGDLEYYNEAGFGLSISSGISNGRSGTSFYIGDYSTPAVYGVTTLLLILALIFASLMVVSIILNWFGKNIKLKLPLILGIMAIIFCILAPFVFMAALPGAMKADAEKSAKDTNDDYKEPNHDDPTKSFFGSYEDKDGGLSDLTRSNWGGDIGWVLSIASFAMLLISVILIIPTRTAHPSSHISPELSYKPEPQPSRRERYDRDQPPRRSHRSSPPLPQNLEHDFRLTQKRDPPRY